MGWDFMSILAFIIKGFLWNPTWGLETPASVRLKDFEMLSGKTLEFHGEAGGPGEREGQDP